MKYFFYKKNNSFIYIYIYMLIERSNLVNILFKLAKNLA